MVAGPTGTWKPGLGYSGLGTRNSEDGTRNLEHMNSEHTNTENGNSNNVIPELGTHGLGTREHSELGTKDLGTRNTGTVNMDHVDHNSYWDSFVFATETHRIPATTRSSALGNSELGTW